MHNYDLMKQHMALRMQQADNERLAQHAKLSGTTSNRLFSRIIRSQRAKVSAEQTIGVPAHQLTPSGTL